MSIIIDGTMLPERITVNHKGKRADYVPPELPVTWRIYVTTFQSDRKNKVRVLTGQMVTLADAARIAANAVNEMTDFQTVSYGWALSVKEEVATMMCVTDKLLAQHYPYVAEHVNRMIEQRG